MQESGGPQGWSPPPPPPAPPPAPALSLPPWEERHRYRFLDALYLTIREVLFNPDQFFSRLPVGPGLWQPLLFALIVGVISSFMDWMWSLAGSSLHILVGQEALKLLRQQLVSTGSFVLSPVIVLVFLFVRAGIVHLCLALLGADRAGFEGTFRVAAYTDAIWILAVLPACGNVLALVWGTVITIIGLQRVHRTEGWRVILAVLLPLLLCLASCSGLVLTAVTRGLLD